MPVPFLDLLLLPAIQALMIFYLARIYGQPLSGTRFLELASSLGLGLVMRQASRGDPQADPVRWFDCWRLAAAASTLALGKAFLLTTTVQCTKVTSTT